MCASVAVKALHLKCMLKQCVFTTLILALASSLTKKPLFCERKLP